MDKQVIVLGRAGMDLYADPPGTRFEEAGAFTAALGGSTGNMAAGLARQGVPVALLSCLSDDPIGAFCLAQLAAYGVDTRLVRKVGGGARTSLAFAETRGPDTRSVLYRNGAADFLLSPDDVARVDFSKVSSLIVTGTALASDPSRGAVFAAFEAARAAGAESVIDLDYRPYSWASGAEAAEVCGRAAAMCDVVIGNDDEFDVLGQGPGTGLATARDLAARGATVVYKMGEKGSRTITPQEETPLGIYRVEALKPTGAGDAFMSGFMAARLSGRLLDEAVRRGSASAAIVVSRVGCAPAMPTPDEVDRFLASHPGLSPAPKD